MDAIFFSNIPRLIVALVTTGDGSIVCLASPAPRVCGDPKSIAQIIVSRSVNAVSLLHPPALYITLPNLLFQVDISLSPILTSDPVSIVSLHLTCNRDLTVQAK